MTNILCIVGFFVGFLIYRQGVKDGLKLKNGNKLEKIMPVHKKPKELDEKTERFNKGMASILDYRNRDKKRSEE